MAKSKSRNLTVFGAETMCFSRMADAELESEGRRRFDVLIGLMRRTAEAAAAIGEVLIELKKRGEHGNWQTYVRETFGISEDTALRYMTAAKRWPDIGPLWEENPRLTLNAALAFVKSIDGTESTAEDGTLVRGALAGLKPEDESELELVKAIGKACGSDKVKEAAEDEEEQEQADSEAAESEDDDEPPPPSHVRMLQLFMNTTTLPQFQDWVDALGKVYGTGNMTDTVMRAVKAEYERMCRHEG